MAVEQQAPVAAAEAEAGGMAMDVDASSGKSK